MYGVLPSCFELSPGKRVILVVALSLLAALPLSASFFMRMKGSAADLVRTTGAREIYRSDATVNGRAASVTALGYNVPMREAAAAVRSLWKLPPLEAGSRPYVNGAWITREESGRKIDFLLLPGADASGCSAWLIESDLGGRDAAAVPALPDTNPLPGGELLTWIEVKRTHSLFTVHEAAGSPEDVLASIASNLASDGWEPVIKGSSTAIFARDGRACVAIATPVREGVARASVLRQRAAK